MSNIEIIQELYRAFEAEGLDRILELCDPDCVVTQDDALPWGGRHEGLDGVATFGIALGGTVHSVVTADAMFEAGDRVIQCGRSRATERSPLPSSTSIHIRCSTFSVRRREGRNAGRGKHRSARIAF
jgi:ketosteroid isomerase-like protein